MSRMMTALLCLMLLSCGEEGGGDPALPCNGAVHLCGSRLDQMVVVRTNNGHAAEELGFLSANHQHAIPRQLQDGVRAISVDVHEYQDELWLCHGACELGKTRFSEALGWIASFLELNPREVMLLDVENLAPVADVAAALEAAGLDSLAHAQTPGAAWPDLGTMIDAGRRLVVLSTDAAGGPLWLNPASEIVFGTPGGAASKDELSCELETPVIAQGLFKLTHTVGTVASAEAAAEVNAEPFLSQRIDECEAAVGHPVNLLSVDYYSEGDVLEASARRNDQ